MLFTDGKFHYLSSDIWSFDLVPNRNPQNSSSSNNLSVDGWKGDDIIKTGSGSDEIYGGEGNDQIDGGSGNDTIFGHEGNDSIYGGSGDDIIYGQ